MQTCGFDNNHAEDDGGAVRIYDGTMAIHSCTFTNCRAGRGGALSQYGGEMDISYCNFTNNTAEVGSNSVVASSPHPHHICICNGRHEPAKCSPASPPAPPTITARASC